MENDDLVVMEGWFKRWKKRKNISFIKTHEEQEVSKKPILVHHNCGLKLIGPNCLPVIHTLIFLIRTRLGFILELYHIGNNTLQFFFFFRSTSQTNRSLDKIG